MSDDIRGALEDAGRRDVPEPRPEFAAALEARLLAQAGARPPIEPRRRARRWSLAGMAASVAAIALILAIGIVIVGKDQPSPNSLELSDAVNVVVTLTDGTTLIDPDGLLLPDGAVVQVGVDGSARIGDAVLGAGDTATVGGQRLRIDRQPRSAVVPRATAKPRSSGGSSASSSHPADSSPPTARPDSSASATATPTRPEPTPTPRATPTPTTTPEPSPPSPTPTPVPHLQFAADVIGSSEIQVSWRKVPGARRYVLIGSRSRSGPAPRPRYPGSWVIGRFARPPADGFSFTVKDAVVEVRLRVVALGPDGLVIARSRIKTLSLPGPGVGL